MTSEAKPPAKRKPPTPKTPPTPHAPKPPEAPGLPAWVTVTVVLTVLGCIVYIVVAKGPESYPLCYMLGGILGAYSGIDRAVKSLRQKDERDTK